MKRVLLITEYFYPHWTGISQTFFALAKNIADNGNSVTVLTTQFDKKLVKKEVVGKVTIIRSPFFIRLSRTHYSAHILFQCIKIVREFDTVVINSPNSNVLFFAIITKLFRKKLIVFHQGDIILPSLTGNQFINRLLEKIFDALTIPSMWIADNVSTPTEDYAKNSRVMKHFMYKFFAFIPDFTLHDTVKPSPLIIKKFTTLKRKGPIIGFAGRFVEEKGYDVLLKAIPHVVKVIGPATFVFAGKTVIDYEPFFSLLKRDVVKNNSYLSFFGLLNKPDLMYFYKNIDVFVISSRSDCFPTTQIESVLMGTPVVSTDIPGARMLIKKSGFGELAEKDNPKSLARAIVKVIKNKQTYNKNHKSALQFLQSYGQFNLN